MGKCAIKIYCEICRKCFTKAEFAEHVEILRNIRCECNIVGLLEDHIKHFYEKHTRVVAQCVCTKILFDVESLTRHENSCAINYPMCQICFWRIHDYGCECLT